MSTLRHLAFLKAEQVREIQGEFGTPTFVYDQLLLERQAQLALGFPNPFGLTARYAMKACPSAAVLRILHRQGLHIDASSGFEVHRALRAGIPPEHLLLTAQELPGDLERLLDLRVGVNACSLHQLEQLGRLHPGRRVGIRMNPGLGSGHSNRTNVGGPSASFGIWHTHLDQVLRVQAEYDLHIELLHSHIGSGSDPEVWQRCAHLSLEIAAQLPEVTTVNLGGGFKVGRMPGESATDLHRAGAPIAAELERFERDCGRALKLEIEPGTFLVANAGALVCSVADIVDTGEEGYRFIKVDAGMTEMLRPSMYGAQHPIVVVPPAGISRSQGDFLVVGHCCESGDVLTPEPGNPEGLLVRTLYEPRVGDVVVIGGTGAYCAGMAAKNYNSFPEATEVLLAADGSHHLIRRRQTLDQIVANESIPAFLTD
ncbi:MAG: diaminopimelate decarboxylase [Gemmatimonadetes bacterium]|nr:diaminopimelate decarboxylase [Gemmatimonadota bacterium]